MTHIAAEQTGTAQVLPADTSRRIRRDLRFVRWYAHTVKHVMKSYSDDAKTRAAEQAPANVLTRVEIEVAAECSRMRLMFSAILGVVLMPFLLAGFLWSGMYWLPVRIPWFPFERDVYGLPLFSLYEWLAFLLLAAFLAYAGVMLAEGLASTRRVSTDFRRLAAADLAEREAVVHVAAGGAYPRVSFLLGRAAAFAAYAPLLAAESVGAERAVDDESAGEPA